VLFTIIFGTLSFRKLRGVCSCRGCRCHRHMRPTAWRAGRRRQSGTPTPCFCCCPPTSVLSSPSSSNPSTVLPTRVRVRQACQTDCVLLVREVKSSRMCVGRCFLVQILRRRSGRPDPLRDHVVHCYNSWPPGCKTFSVLSEDTGLSSKSQTRRPIVAIIVSYALIGRRLCLGGASSSASTPSGSLTASRRPPASTTAYGRAGGLDHLGHAAPSSPSRPH